MNLGAGPASGESGAVVAHSHGTAADAPPSAAPATTSGTELSVRPPPGPARGVVAAPAWAVVTLAGALVVAALVYLALRPRSGRKS